VLLVEQNSAHGPLEIQPAHFVLETDDYLSRPSAILGRRSTLIREAYLGTARRPHSWRFVPNSDNAGTPSLCAALKSSDSSPPSLAASSLTAPTLQTFPK